MKTRIPGIFIAVLLPILAFCQGGDQQLRNKANALFDEQRYAEAMPMYSQLVSLSPSDHDLNYRFGACLLFGGTDKEPAIGHLKFATGSPSVPPLAWYWLGRAYHLNYRFREAQAAYQRFLGTGDRKAITEWPVDALEKQCRNGEKLLSNLKEISVRNKVEVDDTEFFRFYDLSDIGGRIVVLPDELKTNLDKKKKERSLVYLPARGGPIYFSSYGKDGSTGRDIYRTELLTDGTFASPIKLAGYINTDQDEDFAFMHPDGKTFYFSSKGHNSMGGYDVFRASYDAGLDAFGRPENMDFAVNTPDDDVFYLVDPEQKEACFASGRDSRQGKLHVYRVATAQQPIIITVFKGTYASTIDADDRRAHILVEDAVTRERVADVRTDINGSYVLALPRSGKFRYLVECGPSGKTHTGVVDIPKSQGPRAYRQELVLGRNGDLEQLTIRNYFEDPLEGDLIELALDEIKRRSKLDVTPDRPIAEVAVTDPEPSGDVMTRAGFAGDIDKAKAVQLAREDALEQETAATELGALGREALAIAVESASEADRTAEQAAALANEAIATSDEAEKNAKMAEAAKLRQVSRGANLRARAAFRTGQELENTSLNARQGALVASKLATDVAGTIASDSDPATLAHLTALKQRLDEKSRPDIANDPEEKARRAVTEHQKDVDRALRTANTKRADENELTDRVARLKRERDETRSRSKQDELGREIGEYERQLVDLRKETIAVFNQVAAMERQTAALRGQALLTRHLTATGGSGRSSELSADQVAQLGLRITNTDSRIAAIQVDERFDVQFAGIPPEQEARLFNWDLASAGASIGTERAATRAADRSANGDAQLAEGRASELASDQGDRELETAHVATVPTGQDGAEGVDRTTGGTDQRTQDGQGSANTSARSTSQERGVERATEARTAGIPDENTARSDAQAGTSSAATLGVPEKFLLENQRAELAQLADAERNRVRKDSLLAALASVDARLRNVEKPSTSSGSAQDPMEGMAEAGDVDMTRPIMVFDKDADEAVLISELFADYQGDRSHLEKISDADQRVAGIHGLELMLADSLRAEMTRQVAVLQLSPEKAGQVLPRVDRLRRIRDEHIARGEEVLAKRQEELAGLVPQEPLGTAPPTGRPVYTAGNDPINDRFVVVDRYAENVYESVVNHRSNAKGVNDAIAFKEADVARMDDLTARIDSLEDLLSEMTRDRNSEKLRKSTDQLIDERLIIRTDLGQRSAFLTKEEWRTNNDSLDRLGKRIATRGLAPNEPLVLMANGMHQEATQQFDQAAQLRKRADRIDDIVARDSLYRRAYAMELGSLRELDRAITVRNYLAGSMHQRGETLAYEVVAAKVLKLEVPGATGPLLADSKRSTGTAERTGVLDGPKTSPVVRMDTENAAGTGTATDDVVRPVDGPITASPDPALGVTTEQTDGRLANDPQAGSENKVEAETVGERSSGEGAANTSTIAAVRTEAGKEADRIEQSLTKTDRVPAGLYESYLASEPTVPVVSGSDPVLHVDLLEERATRSAREASELEQRSVKAADRASALADSAATVRKKRDKEELERLAQRERAMSDSLHSASLLAGDQARESARMKQDADAASNYRERLMKFYYLSEEEMDMVLQNGDQSRYFQARTRALEQYAASDDAASAARSNREVSDLLRDQATKVDPKRDGAKEHATVLMARADLLAERADSLDNVSARLRGAAGINENQASVMLQGLPAERSSEIMAMEMRTRRTEALLAETRGQAGRPRDASTDASQNDGAAATGRTEDPAKPVPPTSGPDRSSTSATATEASPVQPVATDARSSDRAVESVPAAGTAKPYRPVAFRMPEELVEDIFVLRPAAERRAEPIPMDAEMPTGIVFKVQIGAFRNAINEEVFSDMAPVMGETVGNGLVRYTAGLFTGFERAANAKDLVRDRGYRDAFVAAYRDGERIPLGDAMRAERAATTIAANEPARPTPIVVHGQPERGGTEGQVTPVTIAPPVVTPIIVSEPDAANVLASYPSTAEEIIARFVPTPDAATYYNVPGAAPARQVETVKGLFYTVQVGVYSKPVPLGKLFNITPLNSERTETEKVRYTTGVFLEMEAARLRKDETVVLGVKDAFVTAYLNGKRIPMREANALLEKFGPSILAKP